MTTLGGIALKNIDLINQDSNLFHRTGTGTFWIDSKDGTLKIGHTGINMILQGNITVEGNLDGATGPTGHIGPTGSKGYTGATGQTGSPGIATNTGATGPTGMIGPPGLSSPANVLALRNSISQTIANNSYVSVLFNVLDDINSGLTDITYSTVSGGSRFENSLPIPIHIQINYQVLFSSINVYSGSNLRLSYISINGNGGSPPYNNRYGVVSIQAQLYGTSCQGNCILTLNPGDYFEVWTYQNSGSSQDIGGISGNIEYTNRIQISKLVIGPTGSTGNTGPNIL